MKNFTLVFIGLILYSFNVVGQTSCDPQDLPYYNNFDDGDIECWTTIDSNGDNLTWHLDETQASIGCSAPGDQVISINYNFSLAMDDWLFSPALNLESGINYTFSFSYGNDNSTNYVEALSVYLAYYNTVNGAMDGQIILPTVEVVDGCHEYENTVSVSTSGTYYLAFRGTSSANQNILMIDDVYLGEGGLSVEENSNLDGIQVFVRGNELNILNEGKATSSLVRVVSNTGQVVFRDKINLSLGTNNISLPTMSTGIYLVAVSNENRWYNQKIVVGN